MLDDILLLQQQESYHFQLVPLWLRLVGADSHLPSQGTTYRFALQKGHHKFDENKHPIEACFTERNGLPTMAVSVCKLNFYVPNYHSVKRQQFLLQLTQRECGQELLIGEYLIDASNLIKQYQSSGINKHHLTTFFSQDYELEFDIYLEKTRSAVEKVAKQSQFERNSIQNMERRADRTNVRNSGIKSEKGESEKQIEQQAKSQTKSVDKQKARSRTQNSEDEKKQQKNLFKMFYEEDDQRSNKKSLFPVQPINKVPLIYTKFKQLAKIDTPIEIVLAETDRLSLLSGSSNIIPDQPEQSSNKALIFMWIYILVGLVVLYICMHPFPKT